MESDEEVQIVGVDYSTECLCISRTKDKRTRATSASRGLRRNSDSHRRRNADSEDCIIIDDTKTGPSKEKPDCIEVAFIGNTTNTERTSRTSSYDMPSTNLCSHTERCSRSPNGFSENPKSQVEQPAGRGSPSSSMPGDSHLLPSFASIFSSIKDAGDLQGQEEQQDELSTQMKDQTVPTIAPFHVPLPSGLLADVNRTPKCWTVCPNCPPGAQRKFHLIDVSASSAEWAVVSAQLVKAGYTVSRIRRIQNESLWQRLCYEKQLMLREKKDVNEQLLFHTSRSAVEIISEEGLDFRLSMNGNFGSGIYFSDDPVKCNCYWRSGLSTERHMFCCRVLLGDIKIYPQGVAERLRREPRKENWQPGDQNKYYDSVMGNLSGQNEFIVYNMYRVMPEYILYYAVDNPDPWQDQTFIAANINPLSSPAHFQVAKQLHGVGPHNAMLHQMLLKSRKKKRKKR